MSLILYKFIAALVILLTSLLAVIYPIKVRAHPKHHRPLELGDALASGIFLGAALFHMLPDAIREFLEITGNMNYPIAELLCAIGFAILVFLERLAQRSKNASTTAVPYVLTLILIIHALIEGAALGINTTMVSASIIFVAILAHKGSESFALAVVLNQSKIALKPLIFIVVLFSLMTPLGILLGTTLASFVHMREGQLLTAGFNAFAAGTFLYMSTLHHVNHHERSHDGEGLLEFVFLMIGLGIMAVLGWGLV